MRPSNKKASLTSYFNDIDEDQVGTPQVAVDLQTLHLAKNYRNWLYDHIKPALGKRILEIGSGIGNYTEFLLGHGDVWATDMEDVYLNVLQERFGPKLQVGHLTLDHWDLETRKRVKLFHPDTIICLNVLEHIEKDAESVQAMLDCVDVDGRILLILPALPALYSKLDATYGHYRRYNTNDVKRLVDGFPNVIIERQRYFNFVGIGGWWFNHVLLERVALPVKQTHFFDKIVPAMSVIEKVIHPPIGLSLVVWLRKVA